MPKGVKYSKEELDLCRQIFAFYDRDKNGCLDARELRSFLLDIEEPVDDAEQAAIVAAMDRDRNGKIDLEEFLSWWQSPSRQTATATTAVAAAATATHLEAHPFALALAPLIQATAHAAHIAIAFSPKDGGFAKSLAGALEWFGFRVTTDQEKLHSTPVFVLIYSEQSERSEDLVRNLTRAAERFNEGSAVIIPVSHPACASVEIDDIPDRLAYSLAATNMVDFAGWEERLPRKAAAALCRTALACILPPAQNPVTVTGMWRFSAFLGVGQGFRSSKTAIFQLVQKPGSLEITGQSPCGLKLTGSLSEDRLKVSLKWTYKGPFRSGTEHWLLPEVEYTGAIEGLLVKERRVIEGTWTETFAGQAQSGPASGRLADTGISGMYDIVLSRSIYDRTKTTLAIHHLCGSQLSVELPETHGVSLHGTYDNVEGTLSAVLWLGGPALALSCEIDHAGGLRGCIFSSGDVGVAATFVGTPQVNLVDPHFLIGSKSADPDDDDDDEDDDDDDDDDDKGGHGRGKAAGKGRGGMLAHLSWDHHPREMDFEGATTRVASEEFVPLRPDEMATVVLVAGQDKSPATALTENLTSRGIKPIGPPTFKGVNTRTAVILLTKETKNDPAFVDAVCALAESRVPIFNIGLSSWFEIFGDPAFEPGLKSRLMNALARLNQTDANTLNPKHAMFKGLVKGIKRHTEPPHPVLTGAWAFTFWKQGTKKSGAKRASATSAKASGAKKPAKDGYTQLERSACPKWLPQFLFFTHNLDEDSIEMVTPGDSENLEGEFDAQSMTVKGHSEEGKILLSARVSQDGLFLVGSVKRPGAKPGSADHFEFTAERNMDGISSFYELTLLGDGYDDDAEPMAVPVIQRGGHRVTLMLGDEIFAGSIYDGMLVAVGCGDADSMMCASVSMVNGCPGLRGFRSEFKDQGIRDTQLALADMTERKLLRDIVKRGAAPAWLQGKVNAYFAAVGAGGSLEAVRALWADPAEWTPAEYEEDRSAYYVAYGAYVDHTFMGGAVDDSTKQYTAQVQVNFEEKRGVLHAMTFESAEEAAKLVAVDDLNEAAEAANEAVWDVMISYRSQDIKWVDLLQAYLEDNGFVIWRDRSMEVGDNWSEKITQAVRESKVEVCCLSKTYVTSSLCTKEIRLASEVGHNIFPIVLPAGETSALVRSPYTDETIPSTVAEELAPVTWLDLRDRGAANGVKDPTDLASFKAAYGEKLGILVAQIQNVLVSRLAVSVAGLWNLDLEGLYKGRIFFARTSSTFVVEAFDPATSQGLRLVKVPAFHGSVLTMHLQRRGASVPANEILVVTVRIDGQGKTLEGRYATRGGKRGRAHGERTHSAKDVPSNIAHADDMDIDTAVARYFSLWDLGDYECWLAEGCGAKERPGYTKEKFETERNADLAARGYFQYCCWISDNSEEENAKVFSYQYKVTYERGPGTLLTIQFDDDYNILSAVEVDAPQ